MANQLLSWIGWYILPSKLAEYLLYLYYGLTIRAGDPKPQPGTPRYARHRRNALVFVILCYFLYTLYEADWEMQRASHFYRDLGVPVDATEKAINSRFRRLTVQYHPDKISDPADIDTVNAYFAHLTQARDTLIDPAKRFAYDRFGKDMLDWKGCVTVTDFSWRGMRQALSYYLGSAFVLVGMTMLGYLEAGRYWRYLLFSMMAIAEFTVITSPVHPAFLTAWLNPLVAMLNLRPPYLPFQILSLLHRAGLSGFIAIQQLSPLFPNTAFARGSSPQAEAMQSRQLDKLEAIIRGVTVQTGKLLEFEMAPFATDEASAREVKTRFREWLVQNTVRQDPEVRDRIGRAIQAKRAKPSQGS